MFSALNHLCTATAPGSEKHCTWMAKTAPYPPCTGTVIWLACWRVPGLLPDAASGNAYYPYQRAVSCKAKCNITCYIPGLYPRAHKSFAAHLCNYPFAAKHMLLCPPGLRHLDKISWNDVD